MKMTKKEMSHAINAVRYMDDQGYPSKAIMYILGLTYWKLTNIRGKIRRQ